MLNKRFFSKIRSIYEKRKQNKKINTKRYKKDIKVCKC